MEQTQFSSIIQASFQLQVSIKDNRLYIHAQNLQDNIQFKTELERTSIAQLTKNLFSDAQSMGQALQEAANRTSPDSKLSLNHDGRLDYSAHTPEGKFSFSLELNREKALGDPVVSLQEEIEPFEIELERVRLQYQEELTNMKLEYEERIARLEQMVLEEQEKNAMVQAEDEGRRSRSTEQSATKNPFAKGQMYFGGDTGSAGFFDFSDNYQTAKLVRWGDSRALRCYPEVPWEGKHTFALKVNQMSSWIGFGVTTWEEGKIYQGDEGNYYYFIGDGKLLTKTFETNDKIQGAGENDSVVEMTVDMDARVLVFVVDGIQVRSCKLNTGEIEYRVFVDFASMEDCVTLA